MGQMQTVAARLPNEDLEWLSSLSVQGATTPSDKLRALISQVRRQHEGTLEYAACVAWIRELISPFMIGIREFEHRNGVHSAIVEQIAEWLPRVVAILVTQKPGVRTAPADVRAIEAELTQMAVSLLGGLLRQSVTSVADTYDAAIMSRQSSRIAELAQLILSNYEEREGEKNG